MLVGKFFNEEYHPCVLECGRSQSILAALHLFDRLLQTTKSISEQKAAMAFEDYIRDFSYLLSGDLSDLTLNFGSKTWQVHKALTVCHSKWFQKPLLADLR